MENACQPKEGNSFGFQTQHWNIYDENVTANKKLLAHALWCNYGIYDSNGFTD